MKKIMLIAAAAAGLVAMADGVESGVVGYNTSTISRQYTMFGVNFTATGGGNISIQDVMPYAEGMTAANIYTSADQIQVQGEDGNYVTYYLSNGKNGKGVDVAGLANKWAASGKFVVSDATLAPGTAFWFIKKESTFTPFSVVTAGGVSSVASYDQPIRVGFKLIANPYPTDLYLNQSIPYVEGMTTANIYTSADQIQIPDATGNYVTYYLSNGKNGKGVDVSGLDKKWALSGKFVPADDAHIPVGGSAWYIRKGNTDFTLTISKPYDL